MKANQKSIAIIICYLGKLPWYFDHFAHSCKYNPTVDFIIVTDDTTYSEPVSFNVKFVYKSLAEINACATEKLGLPVQIINGYKLCDFKPTYGIIFSELLQGYDFWGQCDIDVIFGDLRYFLDERMLNDFDFINVRHDYTAGCFYLFRNNPFMNNFFRRSKDYQKVLSSSEHFCFDECNFGHRFLSEGKSIFEIETPIQSFTHIIRTAERNNEIKAYFDFILIEGVPGRIKFNNGKIIYKNTFEAILYHLIGLKQVYRPKSLPAFIPGVYYISPTRIYHRIN